MSPHDAPYPYESAQSALADLPLLLDAEQLLPVLHHPLLRIVDLGKPQVYEQVHLPHALSIAPKALLKQEETASGLLPDLPQLQQLIESLSITPHHHIVVYDDEGGAWAGRLIWTVHLLGFTRVSLLNGGIHYWLAQGFPISNEPFSLTTTTTNTAHSNDDETALPVQANQAVNANFRITMDQLKSIVAAPANHSCTHSLWDCRSFEEYTGDRLAARRGGHIPHAMHLSWDSLFDRNDYLRLKPLAMIHHLLAARGLDFDKPVIVYCQSHHRSGLAYVVARLFNLSVQAYDGAWSEWGNQLDTPVVTGEHPL